MLFRKCFTYFCLLSMAILPCSCSKVIPTYVTYQGNVFDITTKQPKPGVVVHLQICNGGNGDQQKLCANWKTDIGSCTTDAQGHFYIHAQNPKSDWYWVLVNNTYVSSEEASASDLTTSTYTKIYY